MEASLDKPATLAAAHRERRDIVTGEVMDEAVLIRFVAGPGGQVVPDLARKLPGRGIWVAANRASVETATKKGLFARAAKAKVSVSPDLPDQVESLLKARLLSGLGLARRGGALVSGFEKVAAAIEAGKAAWLIEASARMRSRNRAARSKSIASDDSFISCTKLSCTALLLPSRKPFTSAICAA